MARRRPDRTRQAGRSDGASKAKERSTAGIASIERGQQTRRIDRLLNVKEVAEFLGVPVGYVYRHAGVLGGVKIGKYLRFSMDELITYLERNRLMPRRRSSHGGSGVL